MTLDRRAWGTLIVLCGALFLDGLDVSMVGMTLPSLETHLHLSISSLQWIVSGYTLGYGGLLLLGGRAADLLGRRRVFLVALAVFAVASLLGGLSNSAGLLIAMRFVKGAAAAFTAPAGLSIITTSFAEGPARTKAMTVYTATGASGFSLGLVLGGLLTSVGWRWTFLMPAPVALVVLAGAIILVPRHEGIRRMSRSHYDLPGAATVTTAMLSLVYTVVEAPQRGWASSVTIAGFALSAALFAIFVRLELRSAHPLVRLGIFRTPGLAGSNLAAFATFGCYVGFQFVATIYLQEVLGWSPLRLALGLLPAGIIVSLAAQRTGRLIDRIGTRPTIVLSFVAFLVGYALFLRIGPHASYVSVVLPTVLLLGVGFGLGFPAINIAATTGVADEEQGLASGMVQTSFQVGGALVLALVTAVVSSSGHAAGSSAPRVGAVVHGITVVTGVAALALAGSLVALRAHRRPIAVDVPAEDHDVEDELARPPVLVSATEASGPQ
ncbi:MAG: transporter [Acidimicrobiaceae bacterium]|jgi:EmrB/QacA subfamily drug resistance transporter|nr:transporter [Acidimicrobiaceae bacterium]